jgi:hypothetical protein
MTRAAPRLLPEEDAAAWVLARLRGGARTTRELDEQARAERVSCPDGTARFLARLHRRGLVEGRLDVPRRTWVWWLPA